MGTIASRGLLFMTSIMSPVLTLGGSSALADVANIDWSAAPTKKITLFYPGQSSYQWLRSAKHKRASVVNGSTWRLLNPV